MSIGLCIRQLRQIPDDDGLSLPETSVLKRLELGGPTTVTALARAEEISGQSMGATVRSLEGKGLVDRRADPDDGRSALLSIAPGGRKVLTNRRGARTEQLTRALSDGFTTAEIEQLAAAAPLIERLALNL
jgi:DNA-binding MarR family transcriptional regulator